MEDRKPSPATVQPIGISDAARAELVTTLQHHSPEIIDVAFGDRWGYARNGDALYVLCTEGVGTPIEDFVQIPVYGCTADESAEHRVHGEATLILTNPETDADITLGEPVPLHDWIRVFGARLEANYTLWRRLLEQ